MAATAETIQNISINQQVFDVASTQLIEVVPDMEDDAAIRFRAARFIGACLVNEQVIAPLNEANLTIQPIESLYDAIRLGVEGDEDALKLVETNVRTDVIERTIKSGHVISVDLCQDEAGRIQQHGQSMESVQANSLRFAADNQQMQERTKAEATNAFRIQQHYDEGRLEAYSFVVFSRAADNMTKKEMDEAGFFTDTMSCAIQVTSAKGGRLTTESAFVSGIKVPGDDRHDADTIALLGDRLGVDYHDKSAAEIINTPLLIHNSLLENGVVDLVKLYDECAGGTFFGEVRPTEDYVEYKQKCEEREQMLQPKVDAVVRELLSEAPLINDRLTAVKRLHKISEKHMVEQAVFDDAINPLVFGPEAAVHIMEARIQFAQGNYDTGLHSLKHAKQTAKSNSCPSALKKALSEGSIDGSENGSDGKSENNDDDCEFVSKKCPICGEKNVLTTVRKLNKRDPKSKTVISGDCGCAIIR